MDIIYLLMAISTLVIAGVVVVFVWSVRSGQFDDLTGPAYRVLSDDDEK